MTTTTRRGLLVNGILALASASAAAASVPLLEECGHSPDVWCLDACAHPGHPGYYDQIGAYHWAVYLDGQLVNPVGSNVWVKALDERAGFVDVYDIDAAGNFRDGNVTRRYGKVRFIRCVPEDSA